VSDDMSRILVPVGFLLCCLLGALAVFRPGYLANYQYLEALIFAEILAMTLWNYQRGFFTFLMLVFMWAGMYVPLKETALSARWLVLGLGTIGGCVVYLKSRHLFLGKFHLIALFSMVSALVSATVSAYPRVALLKTLSLILVFLYGATGARVGVVDQEANFLSGALAGCEILVYVSTVLYFVFHYPLYGNPNSLGVVMGIVAFPLLLWGILISERNSVRQRRVIAFALCLLLLLSSYARAGMAAALVSCMFLCVGLRRYRLLMKGVGVVVLAAAIVATVAPPPGSEVDSVVGVFLYKGHREAGIMGSRRSPWDKTLAVIQQHPWFGSGFGTSVTESEEAHPGESFESTSGSRREHGSSYMAILEWTGLLGVVPFFALVLLIGVNVSRVMMWMRRTGSPFSPAVPIAAVLTAGIAHAFFEDWMFAPGFYMCVFFWVLAFLLVDVLPVAEPQPAYFLSLRPFRQGDDSLSMAVTGR
jgi:O-antigen ligase